MAKRPRFSRWRRLPGVYRFHEEKAPDPGLEPTRLTLYLPGNDLDAAEALAKKAKVDTIQEYCAELLHRAIEAERVREHVAEIEARRGPLEGLKEIAADPDFLAEWGAPPAPRDRTTPPAAVSAREPEPIEEPTAADAPVRLPGPEPIRFVEGVEVTIPEELAEGATAPPVAPRSEPVADEAPTPMPTPAAEAVLRHAGQAGDDPGAFLPSLRRGESAAVDRIAELARALRTLEVEYEGAARIPRPIAYALHRLALEAQVLHTDAWPGSFDAWTVDTIRAVQEAVDRVLSGQDIRYYDQGTRPEIPT